MKDWILSRVENVEHRNVLQSVTNSSVRVSQKKRHISFENQYFLK